MKSKSSSPNNAEERDVVGADDATTGSLALGLGFMKSKSSSPNNAEERDVVGADDATTGSLALGLESKKSESSSPKRSDIRFAGPEEGRGEDLGTGGGAVVGMGGGGPDIEARRMDLSSETLSNRLSSFPESKSPAKALLFAVEAEDLGLLILLANAKSDSRSPNKLAVDSRMD
jgi:hypothetical protein